MLDRIVFDPRSWKKQSHGAFLGVRYTERIVLLFVVAVIVVISYYCYSLLPHFIPSCHPSVRVCRVLATQNCKQSAGYVLIVREIGLRLNF